MQGHEGPARVGVGRRDSDFSVSIPFPDAQADVQAAALLAFKNGLTAGQDALADWTGTVRARPAAIWVYHPRSREPCSLLPDVASGACQWRGSGVARLPARGHRGGILNQGGRGAQACGSTATAWTGITCSGTDVIRMCVHPYPLPPTPGPRCLCRAACLPGAGKGPSVPSIV